MRVDPGAWLTATATGPNGTSEFSPAVRVTGGPFVVARHVFYNNSAFDGRDPAAGPADDAAIAPDKRPLLPWEPASFANVTSYTKGINGVMVDVANLPVDSTIGTADFGVRTYLARPGGAGWGLPAGWYSVRSRPQVTVRRGAGVGGSDRVTLTWPDYLGPQNSGRAVANEWIEITMAANGQTGLAQPDVFFVGNLVGETGDGDAAGPNFLRVSGIDFERSRRGFEVRASLTSVADHNRDGAVDRSDLAAARANVGKALSFLLPRLASPPATAGGAATIASATSILREGGGGLGIV
jgi:hypothetical protein